jgi:DNA-3-methyladenine glycosylase II
VNSPLTDDTLDVACRMLARRDPALASIYRAHGAPPLWRRRPGFRTLVRIVLEQQVSLASGRATLRRIEAAHGRVSAWSIADAGEGGLRSVGVTRQKARYCVLLAAASRSGDLDLRQVSRSGDEEAMVLLTAHTGVGRWTAEVYLLMALGRPDVWPAGDLALVKAVEAAKRSTADRTRRPCAPSPNPGGPIEPSPPGCCGRTTWRGTGGYSLSRRPRDPGLGIRPGDKESPGLTWPGGDQR